MEENGSRQKFSWVWVCVSIVVFIAIEIVIGGFVMGLIAGRYHTYILGLKLEMLIMLGSYFLGGMFVGFFSPTVRIFEPAAGAFLAVLVTGLYSYFAPTYRYFGFSNHRLLIGGAIVFVLALLGADAGERLAAKFGNRASKEYVEK